MLRLYSNLHCTYYFLYFLLIGLRNFFDFLMFQWRKILFLQEFIDHLNMMEDFLLDFYLKLLLLDLIIHLHLESLLVLCHLENKSGNIAVKLLFGCLKSRVGVPLVAFQDGDMPAHLLDDQLILLYHIFTHQDDRCMLGQPVFEVGFVTWDPL